MSCPQINPAVVDFDGVPLAPPEVLTSQQGAFCVFSCAMYQAKSFNRPTPTEISNIVSLFQTFQQSRINGGPNIETSQKIMTLASDLQLQVCRVKNTKTVTNSDGSVVSEPDSVLLFYTKPNVTDYSGPFMMLRETKASKFVIYSPHDDSDGTYATTKLAMINSYALALFSNGHERGKVSGGNINLYRESDWVHCVSAGMNLGSIAVEHFANLFPGQVSILFNGIADPTKCMLHGRNNNMDTVFKDAIMANSRITETDFTGYTPTFTIDTLVNTNYYIKCEIPSVIYENNSKIVTDIVLAMEKNSWCW